MIKTFTPTLEFTDLILESAKPEFCAGQHQPSERVLQNILNFSRNLEVKASSILKTVDYIKS